MNDELKDFIISKLNKNDEIVIKLKNSSVDKNDLKSSINKLKRSNRLQFISMVAFLIAALAIIIVVLSEPDKLTFLNYIGPFIFLFNFVIAVFNYIKVNRRLLLYEMLFRLL